MKILKRKGTFVSVVFLLCALVGFISSQITSSEGVIKGRFVNIQSPMTPLGSYELILFVKGDGARLRIADENVYKELLNTNAESIEGVYSQSLLGEFLGLSPELKSYKNLSREADNFDSEDHLAQLKLDQTSSCVLFGSLYSNKELFNKVVAHLEMNQASAMKIIEQCRFK
ncbi:MAG: hypothetical protein KC478_01265 [Bacteriovoracaceae bacterium]|nr:hypothetical protein [Bacteriovoracaceae bacterium]